MDDVRIMRKEQRTMRVVIDGIGVVDIDRGLFKDGHPLVRVDVVSDFDRYGLAPDGRKYTVENGDPGPGVVFLRGAWPAKDNECRNGSPTCTEDDPCVLCYDS